MRRVFERDARRLRKRAAREEKVRSSNGLELDLSALNDGLSSDEDELDSNQQEQDQLKGLALRNFLHISSSSFFLIMLFIKRKSQMNSIES